MMSFKCYYFSEKSQRAELFNANGELTVRNIFSKARTEEKDTGKFS